LGSIELEGKNWATVNGQAKPVFSLLKMDVVDHATKWNKPRLCLIVANGKLISR